MPSILSQSISKTPLSSAWPDCSGPLPSKKVLNQTCATAVTMVRPRLAGPRLRRSTEMLMSLLGMRIGVAGLKMTARPPGSEMSAAAAALVGKLAVDWERDSSLPGSEAPLDDGVGETSGMTMILLLGASLPSLLRLCEEPCFPPDSFRASPAAGDPLDFLDELLDRFTGLLLLLPSVASSSFSSPFPYPAISWTISMIPLPPGAPASTTILSAPLNV